MQIVSFFVAAAAAAGGAVATRFDARVERVDIEQLDGGGAVQAYVHDLNSKMYQPYVMNYQQYSNWGLGSLFGASHGEEAVTIENTGNFQETRIQRITGIGPGENGLIFSTMGGRDLAATADGFVVGQSGGIFQKCMWAADRDGTRSACLGENAFGEGTWPAGLVPVGIQDNSYGVVNLGALNVTCVTMNPDTPGQPPILSQQLFCWDRRQPEGSQLYVVANSTQATSPTAVGDSTICAIVVADVDAGAEPGCVDFSDASAMPPTAFLVHDTVPGSGGSYVSDCYALRGYALHAIDNDTVCWFGRTPQSPSTIIRYNRCNYAIPTCKKLSGGPAAEVDEVWFFGGLTFEGEIVVDRVDRAIYYHGLNAADSHMSRLIRFDADTGVITPLKITPSADDSVRRLMGVPGRGVIFVGNHWANRPTGKSDILFWSGNPNDTVAALDDQFGSDRTTQRDFGTSPNPMPVHHIETGATSTDMYTTMSNYDTASDQKSIQLKISILHATGSVTWSPATSTIGGEITAMLPGRGKNGGPGFLKKHSYGIPLEVMGEDLQFNGNAFSYWNGDPADPHVPFATTHMRSLVWNGLNSAKDGEVLLDASGNATSVLLSTEAGLLLIDADSIYDGAPDLDQSLTTRLILVEAGSSNGVMAATKVFARSGDGMPCFVTRKDTQRGFLCLVEDQVDSVGYSFVSAGGMPDHPLADASRVGHYPTGLSRWYETDQLLEEGSESSVVFRQPRSAEEDDWADTQLMYFDGHHSPVRLMHSVGDGTDDSSGYSSPRSSFILLDGGSKVVLSMQQGRFVGEAGLLLIDMTERLGLPTHIGQAEGIITEFHLTPLSVLDRYAVFIAEDPNTSEGMQLYSLDVRHPVQGLLHLDQVEGGDDTLTLASSMSLFGERSPYVAAVFNEQDHVPSLNEMDDSSVAAPDHFISGDFVVLGFDHDGLLANETAVELGRIYGDYISARDGFLYDNEAMTIQSLVPCDSNANHTCIVEWGPGQDPPAYGEVLFTEGEFVGPNAFTEDGDGLLVTYATSQADALDGYSMAFFDLSNSPPTRTEVDQEDSPVTHDPVEYESTYMKAVAGGICWVAPRNSDLGAQTMCIAPGSVHGLRVFVFDIGVPGLRDDDGGDINIVAPFSLPASTADGLELFSVQRRIESGKEPTILRVVPPTPTPSVSPTTTPSPSLSSTASATPSTTASASPSATALTSPTPSTTTSMQPVNLPDIGRTSATGDAVVCAEGALAQTDSKLLQTVVRITGAAPSDIGCDAASTFVELAAAATAVDLDNFAFWLEPTADGGAMLVMQAPVADAAEGSQVLREMQPQLLSSDNWRNLVESAPSAVVSWDGEDDTVVVDAAQGQAATTAMMGSSADTPTELEDGENTPAWALGVIAALAAVVVVAAAAVLMMCECKGRRQESGTDTGRSVAIKAVRGAEAV